MSGVAIIATLIADDAGVATVVAAAQIFGGPIQERTPLPNLGASMISSTERHTVSMADPTKLRMERVQVSINAASYAQKKQLVELVRAACANRHGPVAGFDLDSILPLGEGPDDDDPKAQIFSGSIDFLVKWRSP